jgi:hypothetical protein
MSRTHFRYEFNGDVYFVIGLPYLIIILGMLNMEHIIYVQGSYFDMNSMVMFVL